MREDKYMNSRHSMILLLVFIIILYPAYAQESTNERIDQIEADVNACYKIRFLIESNIVTVQQGPERSDTPRLITELFNIPLVNENVDIPALMSYEDELKKAATASLRECFTSIAENEDNVEMAVDVVKVFLYDDRIIASAEYTINHPNGERKTTATSEQYTTIKQLMDLRASILDKAKSETLYPTSFVGATHSVTWKADSKYILLFLSDETGTASYFTALATEHKASEKEIVTTEKVTETIDWQKLEEAASAAPIEGVTTTYKYIDKEKKIAAESEEEIDFETMPIEELSEDTDTHIFYDAKYFEAVGPAKITREDLRIQTYAGSKIKVMDTKSIEANGKTSGEYGDYKFSTADGAKLTIKEQTDELLVIVNGQQDGETATIELKLWIVNMTKKEPAKQYITLKLIAQTEAGSTKIGLDRESLINLMRMEGFGEMIMMLQKPILIVSEGNNYLLTINEDLNMVYEEIGKPTFSIVGNTEGNNVVGREAAQIKQDITDGYNKEYYSNQQAIDDVISLFEVTDQQKMQESGAGSAYETQKEAYSETMDFLMGLKGEAAKNALATSLIAAMLDQISPDINEDGDYDQEQVDNYETFIEESFAAFEKAYEEGIKQKPSDKEETEQKAEDIKAEEYYYLLLENRIAIENLKERLLKDYKKDTKALERAYEELLSHESPDLLSEREIELSISLALVYMDNGRQQEAIAVLELILNKITAATEEMAGDEEQALDKASLDEKRVQVEKTLDYVKAKKSLEKTTASQTKGGKASARPKINSIILFDDSPLQTFQLPYKDPLKIKIDATIYNIDAAIRAQIILVENEARKEKHTISEIELKPEEYKDLEGNSLAEGKIHLELEAQLPDVPPGEYKLRVDFMNGDAYSSRYWYFDSNDKGIIRILPTDEEIDAAIDEVMLEESTKTLKAEDLKPIPEEDRMPNGQSYSQMRKEILDGLYYSPEKEEAIKKTLIELITMKNIYEQNPSQENAAKYKELIIKNANLVTEADEGILAAEALVKEMQPQSPEDVITSFESNLDAQIVEYNLQIYEETAAIVEWAYTEIIPGNYPGVDSPHSTWDKLWRGGFVGDVESRYSGQQLNLVSKKFNFEEEISAKGEDYLLKELPKVNSKIQLIRNGYAPKIDETEYSSLITELYSTPEALWQATLYLQKATDYLCPRTTRTKRLMDTSGDQYTAYSHFPELLEACKRVYDKRIDLYTLYQNHFKQPGTELDNKFEKEKADLQDLLKLISYNDDEVFWMDVQSTFYESILLSFAMEASMLKYADKLSKSKRLLGVSGVIGGTAVISTVYTTGSVCADVETGRSTATQGATGGQQQPSQINYFQEAAIGAVLGPAGAGWSSLSDSTKESIKEGATGLLDAFGLGGGDTPQNLPESLRGQAGINPCTKAVVLSAVMFADPMMLESKGAKTFKNFAKKTLTKSEIKKPKKIVVKKKTTIAQPKKTTKKTTKNALVFRKEPVSKEKKVVVTKVQQKEGLKKSLKASKAKSTPTKKILAKAKAKKAKAAVTKTKATIGASQKKAPIKQIAKKKATFKKTVQVKKAKKIATKTITTAKKVEAIKTEAPKREYHRDALMVEDEAEFSIYLDEQIKQLNSLGVQHNLQYDAIMLKVEKTMQLAEEGKTLEAAASLQYIPEDLGIRSTVERLIDPEKMNLIRSLRNENLEEIAISARKLGITTREYTNLNELLVVYPWHEINVNKVSIIRSLGTPEKLVIDFKRDKALISMYESVKQDAAKIHSSIPNPDKREEAIMQMVYDKVLSKVAYSQSTGDVLTSKYYKKFVLLGDVCIVNGAGVCRHQSPLIEALLAKLKADGLILGKPTHMTGPRHFWAEVHYKDANGNSKRYVLDPAQKYIGEISTNDVGKLFKGQRRGEYGYWKYEDFNTADIIAQENQVRNVEPVAQ